MDTRLLTSVFRCLFISILAQVVSPSALVQASRSFSIDYEHDQFLKDGEPFRYVSGSLHYFRVPRAYWQDRLYKLRAAGLNAVSTYVEWNQHEPSPNTFDFSGELDLPYFIQLAQEQGLVVLLRPGPYICAEREMGGLPSWLLTLSPNMNLRTNDSIYMMYAERYIYKLMELLQPQLYGNGGPIIMVQIENEYGSYGACDSNYTARIRDVVQAVVGNAAVLYTTDGNSGSYLRCGKVDGVYATVDFGSGANVTASFSAQRSYEPRGPLINSEFYPGWLTHWGEPLQRVNVPGILITLEQMLERNASVNFYMFFGGTNFGFLAGANYGDNYQPQITSYDYDAPLTEAGDPTTKYYAIREVIRRYLPLPNVTVPIPAPKGQYGDVNLFPVGCLFDQNIRKGLGKEPVNNALPLTFEALGQKYGYVLYEHTVTEPATDPSLFSVPDISDRGTVFVNNVFSGILSRTYKITSLPLSIYEGDKIQVLVENQGRINYGSKINDFKGFVSNATLGGAVLQDWSMTGFPLNDISYISNLSYVNNITRCPTFFRGVFTIPDAVPLDTFLDTTGWGKGVVFINGFNLGRYWPATGPQVTLYVPGCHLKPNPEVNEIIVLEVEHFNSPSFTMSLVRDPILDHIPPERYIRHRNSRSTASWQLNQGPAPQSEDFFVEAV